ncbi:hypothetical protein ACN4EK_24180 [Pantanalinema rosaneae CENA516]|uniref:hypothetical protein n=1 Tax=Pantanalinema rosaneae TaxID=1620701 RepID=UPI003D6F2CB6
MQFLKLSSCFVNLAQIQFAEFLLEAGSEAPLVTICWANGVEDSIFRGEDAWELIQALEQSLPDGNNLPFCHEPPDELPNPTAKPC